MKKYVVILEVPDTGYMDCVGICGTKEEAYGVAYLALSDGLNGAYITLPERREGDNGIVMEAKESKDGNIIFCATILNYEEDEE